MLERTRTLTPTEQRRERAKARATHTICAGCDTRRVSTPNGEALVSDDGYELRNLDGTNAGFIAVWAWADNRERVQTLRDAGYEALGFGYIRSLTV